MRKPRIQMHLPNLYVGGIERWALTLFRGLPEFDWFISTPPGAVTHQSGLDDFKGYKIIQEGDDALSMDALITTWGISNRSVAPTIAVAHSAFQKYREMMRAAPSDFAVAVSEGARCCFPEGTHVDIIYNGVDVDRLQASVPRAATRARLGIPVGATVIGYVGRWGFQKNPLAAAIAAGRIPGAVALYIGPPSDDASLVAEARRQAPCFFVTPEEAVDIGDLYRAMDVCVFASRTEGFGLAIAEAWYCGVPVAATAVGIVAEHPDLVSLLTDDPNAEDLKFAVEKALSGSGGPDVRAARATVVERYSAARMVNDWRDYIQAHLGGSIGR